MDPAGYGKCRGVSPPNLDACPPLDEPDGFDMIRCLAQIGAGLAQEPACQFEHGTVDPNLLKEGARNRYILIQQSQPERLRPASTEHSLGNECLTYERSPTGCVQHLDGGFRRDTGFDQCGKTLSYREEIYGQQRVVDRLHGVPRPDWAEVLDSLSEGGEDRPRPAKGRRVPADHHRQSARHGSAHAAAYGCINEGNAMPSQALGNVTGRSWIAGGAIDQESATLQPSFEPIGAIEQQGDLS